MAAKRRRAVRRRKVAVQTVEVLADGRTDRRNAARYLGKSAQTLAVWATQGKGPAPHRVGGRAYYYFTDLEAYVAAELAAGA